MLKGMRYFGDPVLRKKCTPVKEITEEVRTLAKDLVETVLAMDGAGLSAPQIGSTLRVFVIRYDNGMDDEGWPVFCPPCVMINPILTNPSKEIITHGEGCLSIPGIYEDVSRPNSIEVEYKDLEGKTHHEVVTDWRARVVMHENDHLNGVLFIDRIHPHKKKKIDAALREIKKKYNS